MRARSKLLGRAAFVGVATSFTAFVLMQGCNDDDKPSPRLDSGPDIGAEFDAGTDVKDSGPPGPQPVAVPLSPNRDSRLLGITFDANGNAFAVGVVKNADGGDDFAPAVVKFLPTGAIDTSFGINGVAIVRAMVGSQGTFRGIGLQSTGKVVIAGTIASAAMANDRDIAVIRLNADGKALDSSFALGSPTPGIRVIDLSQADPPATDGGAPVARDEQYGFNVLSDDKLIVTGAQKRAGFSDTDFAVIRLNADGTNDPTFSRNGVFTLDIDGKNASPRRAIVVADGGALVASGYVPGTVSPFTATRPVLFKLTGAGELDPTFGPDGGGIFSDPILPAVTEIYGIAPQGARIVTAGYGKSAPETTVPTDVVSLRFGQNGRLDPNYAASGVAKIAFAPYASNGRAVAVLADSRVVLVGRGQPASDNHDGLVAFLTPDGQPDSTFGPQGRRTYELGGKSDEFSDIARLGNRLAIVGYSSGLSAGAESGYVLFLPVP